MSRDTFVAVHPGWYLSNTGGLLLTGVVAARSGRRSMRTLFWAACALHVGEAVYASRAARAAGFTDAAPRWTAQTLAVGFPSLLALREATAASAGELGPEV